MKRLRKLASAVLLLLIAAEPACAARMSLYDFWTKYGGRNIYTMIGAFENGARLKKRNANPWKWTVIFDESRVPSADSWL